MDDIRIVQETGHNCFFGLPFEIRTSIYVSASMQIGQLGCTKVLGLCSQSYAEAIHWFRSQRTAELTVTGRNKQIFRAPKDFGLPGRFTHHKGSTMCFIQQQYSKLQMFRMHKIVVRIVLVQESPASRSRGTLLTSVRLVQIKSNLDDISRVLASSEAEQLEITFWRASSYRGELCIGVLQSFMRKVVEIATSKQIALSIGLDDSAAFPIEVPDHSNYLDPLINWSIELAESSTSFPALMSHTNHPLHNWKHYRQPKYQIIPECRACLEPFPTMEALKQHLARLPKHRCDFVNKRWNLLHSVAEQHHGSRMCWTCAKSYETTDSLNKHLDKKGHRRNGIIPRYVEDNEWYQWKTTASSN